MTLEELNSFTEFKDLEHIDGDNLDLILEKPPRGHTICSAMEVEDAQSFLADRRKTPQWVEYHTGDNGDVGYEVIFWVNEL